MNSYPPSRAEIILAQYTIDRLVRVSASGQYNGRVGKITKVDDGIRTVRGKTIANIQVQLDGIKGLCRFSTYDLDPL